MTDTVTIERYTAALERGELLIKAMRDLLAISRDIHADLSGHAPVIPTPEQLLELREACEAGSAALQVAYAPLPL